MEKNRMIWRVLMIWILLLQGSIYAFSQYQFTYNLKKPQYTIELPESLKEISGMSLCERQKFLWAVQDEKGIIFKIDIESGSLLDSIPFWKNGDYEGVEVVGEKVYVLKSSGTIYKVQLLKDDSLKIEKFNQHLGKEDNTEGLGYDREQQRLLIACKNGKGGEREIYAFDIQTDTLSKEALFKIRREDVEDYLIANPKLRKWKKLYKMVNDKDLDFAPSAIAIHPITQDVYILSSQGKTLIVLHKDGQIAYIEKLEKEIHAQPEGICFDHKGNLFIANEGKGGTGKIYRFEMRGEKVRR